MSSVKYDVEKTSYRDMHGDFLWEQPMNLSRMWGVGDIFAYDSKSYIVRRVALVDKVQYVNITPHYGL